MDELIQLINILNGLVEEKEIVLGPTLIKKLKAMDNPIAKFILDCAVEKLDIDVDYSFVEFDEQETMVSLLKNRWEEEAGKDIFTTKRREKMKISRLVMALATKKGVKFPEKEIEEFVNKYKSSQKKFEFKEIEGKEIKEWYNEKNYTNDRDGNPSLHNSCMRYAAAQNYFSVYTESPNVRLLALIDNETNKLMGRAIVWKNAHMEGVGAITYMDRVYTAKQAYENLFKDYAKSKGWWFKVVQTNQDMSITNGTEKKGTWLIDCQIADLDWARYNKPYMDSLKYMTYVRKEGRFVPVMTNNANNYKESWVSTSGGSQTNNNYVSEHERLLSVARALSIDQATLKVSDDDAKIMVQNNGDEWASYSIQELQVVGARKFIEKDKIRDIDPANYINIIPAREIWEKLGEMSIDVILEKLIEFEKYINKQNGVNLLIDISTDEEILRQFKYYLNKKYDDVIHYLMKNSKVNLTRFVDSLTKVKPTRKKIVKESVDDDSDEDDVKNDVKGSSIPKGDANEPVTLDSLLKQTEINIQHMVDFFEKSDANKNVCISFLKHKIARLKIRFFLKKFGKDDDKRKRLIVEQIIPSLSQSMQPLDFVKNYLKISNKEFFKLFGENLNRNIIERIAINILQNNANVRKELISVDNRELRGGNYYIYKVKNGNKKEGDVEVKKRGPGRPPKKLI